MVWPAVIGAGAALLGGALSSSSSQSQARRDRSFQREINEQNIQLQREFAQQGIRWRVEDAKAAGLHPLYALSGGGATYTPSAIGVGSYDTSGIGRGLSEAGQHIAGAVARQQTDAERQLHEAQLMVLQAQAGKDNAMASYYASEAARARQTSAQAAPMPENLTAQSFPVEDRAHRLSVRKLDQVDIKPDEVISRRTGDTHITAGEHAAWREHTLQHIGGRRLNILLPYSEEGPAESLESVPWYLWPSIIRFNARHYGPGWFRDFSEAFIGLDIRGLSLRGRREILDEMINERRK